MAEIKKVIATLKLWDNEKNNGYLEAQGITPDIFINKSILGQKKCNITPKSGDTFEVEIEPSKYGGKPSWKVISIKHMERKLYLENFAVKVYKSYAFKENTKNEKSIEIKKLKDLVNNGCQQSCFGEKEDEQVKKYYQEICNRQKQIANTIAHQIEVQNFVPYECNGYNGRIVVGLGGGSVFETAITLHHIYGFPYIPASSIKGILRTYLIETYFENKEAKAFENKIMCDIFGCPDSIDNKKTYYQKEQQGKIIFFDAMPVHSPMGCIKLDIMNPHYSKYYTEGSAPVDWENPVPIIFLTVERLAFQFITGLFRQEKNEEIEFFNGTKNTLLKGTSELLKEALENRGIGAKTAVGYGYMKKQL